MKSFNAFPKLLEKLVINAGAHIEFLIKLFAIHFLLVFILVITFVQK